MRTFSPPSEQTGNANDHLSLPIQSHVASSNGNQDTGWRVSRLLVFDLTIQSVSLDLTNTSIMQPKAQLDLGASSS